MQHSSTGRASQRPLRAGRRGQAEVEFLRNGLPRGTRKKNGIEMAGTIFISYRRGLDTPSAGWLRALLIEHGFTSDQVFLDVDGIQPGEDFVEILEAQVEGCDVLLCTIGRGWLDAIDRLAEPKDYVRIEIAAALAKRKRVIPLLLDEARMPTADLLPEELQPLTRRQAVSLRHDRLRSDLRDLVPVLQKALATPRPQAGPRRQPTPQAPTEPGKPFRDMDAPWCPEMVVIPAGDFMMGSPETEAGRSGDEGPQHRVTIAHSLAIGKFPVTFDEYDHFCAATAYDKPEDQGWGRGRRPVINVSWDDAKAYCAWLSQVTGKPYRLPSEAEWEYACRAGTTTRYAWGDKVTPEKTNYAESKLGKTTEVGAYPPNPWGLHDMHGNVWEWCEDCWHDTYQGAPDDGRAWGGEDGGNCDWRVLRGGSWDDGQDSGRAAARGVNPYVRNGSVGFRVVCSSPSSGH